VKGRRNFSLEDNKIYQEKKIVTSMSLDEVLDNNKSKQSTGILLSTYALGVQLFTNINRVFTVTGSIPNASTFISAPRICFSPSSDGGGWWGHCLLDNYNYLFVSCSQNDIAKDVSAAPKVVYFV